MQQPYIFYADPTNASLVRGEVPPKLWGLQTGVKIYLFLGILLLNGGLWLWHLGQQAQVDYTALVASVRSTPGVMESCRSFQRQQRRSTRTVYAATYRYTVGGQPYGGEIEIGFCMETQIGRTVPLHYLPTDPARFHIAPELLLQSAKSNTENTLIFSVLCLLCGGVFGVIGIGTKFRRARLIRRYKRALIADGVVIDSKMRRVRGRYGSYRRYRFTYRFLAPSGRLLEGRARAYRSISYPASDAPRPGVPLKILYLHNRDHSVL